MTLAETEEIERTRVKDSEEPSGDPGLETPVQEQVAKFSTGANFDQSRLRTSPLCSPVYTEIPHCWKADRHRHASTLVRAKAMEVEAAVLQLEFCIADHRRIR
jgi:hypothetical protein